MEHASVHMDYLSGEKTLRELWPYRKELVHLWKAAKERAIPHAVIVLSIENEDVDLTLTTACHIRDVYFDKYPEMSPLLVDLETSEHPASSIWILIQRNDVGIVAFIAPIGSLEATVTAEAARS